MLENVGALLQHIRRERQALPVFESGASNELFAMVNVFVIFRDGLYNRISAW